MNNTNTVKTTFNNVAMVLNGYGIILYHCFGGVITKAHQIDLPDVVDVDQMPNKSSEIKVVRKRAIIRMLNIFCRKWADDQKLFQRIFCFQFGP